MNFLIVTINVNEPQQSVKKWIVSIGNSYFDCGWI